MEDREAGLGWPMSTCHRSGSTCPQMQGLTERDLSGLALCSRNYSVSGGCQNVLFSFHGLNYTWVCGQLL